MKHHFILVITILLSGLCFAQTDLELTYSSFLGGSGFEVVMEVSAYSNNQYIICGNTNSENFPLTDNAYQSTYNDPNIGYFSIVSESGDLIYSSFFGGLNGADRINAVKVTSDDKILLAGRTEATDFPLQNPENDNFEGTAMAFLSCFDPNQQLMWSTFLGGNGSDQILGMEVYQESIYVTGTSSSLGLGTSGVHQENPVTTDNVNSFVARLTETGEIVWFSYISGSGLTILGDMALAPDGETIYTTGISFDADDHGFINSHQPVPGGGVSGSDCWLAAYSVEDGSMEWGTYYGGNGTEEKGFVEVMDDGTVLLTGRTSSDNNIATDGAFRTEKVGNSDDYIAAFTPAGERMWGTYYGGNSSESSPTDLVVVGSSIYTLSTTNSNSGIAIGNPLLAEIPDSDEGLNSFMARFNSEGIPVWSTFTNQNFECARTAKMIVNENHEIYAAGSFNSNSNDQDCLEYISDDAYQFLFGGGESDIGVFHFQDNVLSTSFYEAEPLEIYPNPAADFITIQAPSLLWAGMDLTVMDVSGRVVDRVVNFQSGNQYNTSELSNGVYVITGRAGERVFREKLVVNR